MIEFPFLKRRSEKFGHGWTLGMLYAIAEEFKR
jgi:hypothetical protein